MSYIGEFIISQSKSTKHLNSHDFQSYLDNYEFTSISQQNQVINSIRFLYKEVLNKKYDKVSFKRPRKNKKLPKVIETNLLLNKISEIKNLKHKTIISLSYSTGMRVSEILNLKIKDVDSNKMIINILDSKGNKDRYVPLSKNILNLLRKYYKKYKPKEYLFNGQSKNHLKYSRESCNNIIKKYLGKEYSFHTLRHSCFTTMTESGIDIRHIQEIAGHSDITTTSLYTHLNSKMISKTKTPI